MHWTHQGEARTTSAKHGCSIRQGTLDSPRHACRTPLPIRRPRSNSSGRLKRGIFMAEWIVVLDINLLMAALVAVMSGVIHGYTGFGAALFMTPLFAILFGPVEAIAIACVIGICGSAQLYPSAARHAAWRELIPIFAGIVVLTPLGTMFLFKTDPELVRRAMGVFIFVF